VILTLAHLAALRELKNTSPSETRPVGRAITIALGLKTGKARATELGRRTLDSLLRLGLVSFRTVEYGRKPLWSLTERGHAVADEPE
jgi:DNA-binding MarR family transcriptional regulator